MKYSPCKESERRSCAYEIIRLSEYLNLHCLHFFLSQVNLNLSTHLQAVSYMHFNIIPKFVPTFIILKCSDIFSKIPCMQILTPPHPHPSYFYFYLIKNKNTEASHYVISSRILFLHVYLCLCSIKYYGAECLFKLSVISYETQVSALMFHCNLLLHRK